MKILHMEQRETSFIYRNSDLLYNQHSLMNMPYQILAKITELGIFQQCCQMKVNDC